MGSGPPRARQSRSLPSLMPLWLKRLLIRPSDERSAISERKFPSRTTDDGGFWRFSQGRDREMVVVHQNGGNQGGVKKCPLWVKSGHWLSTSGCPLCALKHQNARTLAFESSRVFIHV